MPRFLLEMAPRNVAIGAGFVVAVVDVRGTTSSFGARTALMRLPQSTSTSGSRSRRAGFSGKSRPREASAGCRACV